MSHDHTSTTWNDEDQVASEPDFYGKWINAEDSLPESGGRYLVNVNGFGVRIDRYTSSDDVNGWLKYYGYVTHWMNLPPRPKMEP